MFTCKHIYILPLCRRTYAFPKDVWCKMLLYWCIQFSSLLILTISWAIPLPCIKYLFSTLSLMFLLFSKCIYLSLSTSFWYHVLLNVLCLNLLHKSTLVFNSFTCTMTYNICVLHLVCIWDIYLSANHY